MKKLSSILMGCLLGIPLCAQIQTDRLYVQGAFYPNLLPDYDSVVYIPDTSISTKAYFRGNLERDVNGDIKSMRVYGDMDTLWETSVGMIQNPKTTIISTFASYLGPQDTLSKTILVKNISNQDSSITHYDYSGTGLKPRSRSILFYDNSGNIDRYIEEIHETFSQSFRATYDYQFFYSNNRLDSIVMKNLIFGTAMDLLFAYQYNTQGGLAKIEVHPMADISSTPDAEFLVTTNQQNEIVEIVMNSYDNSTQQFKFRESYKFYRSVNHMNISETSDIVQLHIYPNPAKDQLNIDTEVTFDFYEIISLKGQLIKSGELKGSWLSVENLKAGTYLLKLQNESYNRTVRFQKQ